MCRTELHPVLVRALPLPLFVAGDVVASAGQTVWTNVVREHSGTNMMYHDLKLAVSNVSKL